MLSKCDFRKGWPTSTVANCHPSMSVEWTASLLFCLFLFACLLPDKVLAAEEESAIGKSEQQRPAEATTCAFDVSGCGLTKGCLMKPHNCTPHKDCAYAMSYSSDGERVFFELLGKVEAGRNVFVALGFSVDGLMGGDAVTDCASFDGSPFAARLSYNPGKSNRKVPLDQEKMAHILNTEATAYADGILYCRFSQLIQPPGWVQPQFVRSLHTSIYILMSSGPTRGNELTIHSLNMDSPLFPFSSPTPVQLTAFQADPALRQQVSAVTSAAENVTTGSGNGQAKNSNESAPSLLMSSPMASEEETSTGTEEEMLTKAHGVLMLLAWLLLCPFAILSARFLRSEPTQLLGLHLWFQVHRAANSLVFLLVLASFVCIFSANGGAWLGPTSLLSVDNFTAHSMHALFGAAAILLTVCQPLNALFRCSPQSAARFLFDWLHAILGYAAWLCAAVAISIACFRFKNKFWDRFLARDLLIAALALIIVSFCVLQWFSLRHNRQLRREEGNRKAAAAATTTTTVPIPNDGGEQHREGLLIQRAILGLFLATASGLSLALALLVILAGT